MDKEEKLIWITKVVLKGKKYLVYINNFFWWANEKKQPAIQVEAKIREEESVCID